MKESLTKEFSARRPISRVQDKRSSPPILTEAESMLSQQLAKGRDYLAQHMVLLPQPYPGCILFFTVAAENKTASVFYVRSTTLESAWRQGATRVRQWAWARQRDTVQLRIDWVQDITPLKAGCPPPDYTAAIAPRARALALADIGLERAEFLHRLPAAPAPVHSAGTAAPVPGSLSCAPDNSHDIQPLGAPACLLLNLRGIYISGTEPALAVPRTEPAMPSSDTSGGMHLAPLPAALDLLLQQQQDHGGWSGADDPCDHLGLTYALAQLQCHAGTAALAKAIDLAFARFEKQRAQLPQAVLPQALALLMLTRLYRNACAGDQAAGNGVRQALIDLMDEHAEAVLSVVGSRHCPPDTPGHLEMAWAELAMHVYAGCRPRTGQGPALRAAHSALPSCHGVPSAFIHAALQGQHGGGADEAGMRWIGIALAESAQHDTDLSQQPRPLLGQWQADMRRHLQWLRQRTIWPEQALHLPPAQRRQAAFMDAASGHVLLAPRETAQLLASSLASLALLSQLDLALLPRSSTRAHLQAGGQPPPMPPGQAVARPARTPAPIAGSAHRHLPMYWQADALASTMQGRWMELPAPQTSISCAGLDVHRQHHLPGAAVLVRRANLALGVPAAALQALQASVLISSAPHGLFRHGLPVLHVPDIQQGLLNLARAARQRIKAPVIAVTGCAGKTSTLSMLRQCLQEGEDARADALLAQNTALQMINWSETAPAALIELPLQALRNDLSMVSPDILVITNISHIDIPRSKYEAQDESYKEKRDPLLQEIMDAMLRLRKGAVLVIEHAIGGHPRLIQTAKDNDIQMVTFGAHSLAQIRETAFNNGNLQLLVDDQRLGISLKSDGHHMAMNAEAALGTLFSLGLSLNKAGSQLAHWKPLSGAGHPQLLPNGICLLDHSLSNHLLSVEAAFSQLKLHAPNAGRRLIVLAGIQSHQASLDSAQLVLEPLVRAAQARRVLLYGEPLRQLAGMLGDLLHVNWYEDLNQLICSLLRTMHKGDTVLLAGRATANLAIAADAIHDSFVERNSEIVSTRLGLSL